MAATDIKLTYFNFRGLAEAIRLLLKYGEIEFEDVRLEQEKWPETKMSTPFGQMPLYEENGKVSGQSIAITRYVAKKVGLAGANDWENLEVDAVVDTIVDLRLKIRAHFIEATPERKAALKDSFDEMLHFYLGRLDKQAERNGGYLVAGKLTWADFYFTSMSSALLFALGGGADRFENYPNLSTVVDNVVEIPSVKAWIEIRPKTDF